MPDDLSRFETVPLHCDVIVGTRPEAIKMAPIVKVMRGDPKIFDCRVVTSGQQGEICRTALSSFGLEADVALEIGPVGRSLAASAGDVLHAFGRHFTQNAPDIILVQGDTTTAMAAALAGFYAAIPVAHVEAGLRTGDFAHPFPEEGNRCVIDAIATILLPPTPTAQANLLREGFDPADCPITGNTVVDAVRLLCEANPPILDGSGVSEADLDGRRLILVTTHRRENWGGDIEAICRAIRTIVERYEDVFVALPVHPNPNVREPITKLLGDHLRIKLLQPLSYIPFLSLLRRAYLIVTDSGGVQEEAPSFGVPVLVLRRTTERPEALMAGFARIIGTDPAVIVRHVTELFDNEISYRSMVADFNPYGDGYASNRIAEILRNWRAGREIPPMAVERALLKVK